MKPICNTCGVTVDLVPTRVFVNGREQLADRPISKYWHEVKQLAFCSAQCSMIGHSADYTITEETK